MKASSWSIGVVIGALSAIAFGCGEASAQPVDTVGSIILALAAEPQSTAARAALYTAAAQADVDGVKALLERAGTLRDPGAHAFALDVLISRYAELDIGGAVAAAEKAGMPPHLRAPLYQKWIKASPDAALVSLRALDERDAAIIAPSVFAAAEGDETLVTKILAALPGGAGDWYVASSLVRLARDSPREALARAEMLSTPGARIDAVNRVLQIWSAVDPRAVLDYVAALDAGARKALPSGGFWYQLASKQPELVLDRGDVVPADLRANVLQNALRSLAERDPQAAYDRAALMPPGPDRQQAVQMIVRMFVDRDANAALAWARALRPPEPGAVAWVLSGIAAKDPLRALDLAAGVDMPVEQMQAMQLVVASAASRDPGLAPALLDRVLGLANDSQRQRLAQSILYSWASNDPVRAADWAIANAERLPPTAVLSVATQYANKDLDGAAAYIARMPSQIRGTWLRGVASVYTNTNPRAALSWVQQFRGGSEYDDVALAVIAAAARSDPEAAARATESLANEDQRRAAAAQVAIGWATRDPAEAANWALSLADPEARAAATGSVVQVWLIRDPAAAQAWVLSQPVGTARDRALIALVGRAAQAGTVDDALLAGFSEERARLSAIASTAMIIARRDPAAGRAYVESHVEDANRREQMLSMLVQVQSPIGFVTDPVTGVRIPVNALGPPVMLGQGTAFGPSGPPVFIGGQGQLDTIQMREGRLFAPPPPGSKFELSTVHGDAPGDRSVPH